MADFRYAESSILSNENYLLERNTKDAAAADSAVDYSLFPSDLSSRERAVLGRAIRTGSSDPGDAQSTANYLLSGDSLEERSAFLSNAFDGEETANRIADRMDEEASANTVGTVGGADSNSSGARRNPLDDYANYTYGLTMRAISPSGYDGSDTNGQVLVASAGLRGAGYDRAPSFYEDFYFDNFKMTGVIGLNSRTRSSNVITLDFTIVEPYGITFMNRLLEVAKDLGAQNWNEMPFVMQIDFYGNDDYGAPVNPIPDQSKIIPFKLIACKIKASTRGSEYQCSAVPFNHQAFQESVASTPANFEMRAEKVKDFFSNEDDSGSFTAALNKYSKKLVDPVDKKNKKYQDLADEYAFEIADEIANAAIVTNKKVSATRTPMADDNNKKSNTAQGAKAAQTGGSVAVDLNTQLVSINAGTSIIDVINLVLRNSEYVTNQIKSGSAPINWFKIIPKIELMDFDQTRKIYQKKITYKVIKSLYHNTKYPGAPMKLPSTWSKEYNYMYTGLNQSIIDFSIDFDTMFYTAMTAYRTKDSELETQPGETKPEPNAISNTTQDNGIAPLSLRSVAAQTDVSSKEGNNDEKSVAASDLYKSMMSSSRGDMINVKLKIAGDPEFIKQDDFYISEATGELANGSITTDTGEVFVYLRFRSPSDLIQETGLMDFETYKDTVFSGIYRVITVENIFERGQFTQVLDLVRMFDQPADQADGGGGSKMSEERVFVPSGAEESAKALAIDEATRLMDGAKTYSDLGYGATDRRSSAGAIGDNAVLVGGAMGEGDAGAIMEAAREGQASRNRQSEYDGADNASEILRLANRARASKQARNTSEPIPINILGPETFGP